MRDLQVDHHAQGGHRRRQKLGAVNHEVGIHLEKFQSLSTCDILNMSNNKQDFTLMGVRLETPGAAGMRLL